MTSTGDDQGSCAVVVERMLENTTLEVVVYQGQLDIICDVVGKSLAGIHYRTWA